MSKLADALREIVEACDAFAVRMESDVIGEVGDLQGNYRPQQWHEEWLRRARAALAADGWQPIATAPRDGTPLLGFIPTYYQGKGGQTIIVWVGDAWWDGHAFKTAPNHWQPLPAPPKEKP